MLKIKIFYLFLLNIIKLNFNTYNLKLIIILFIKRLKLFFTQFIIKFQFLNVNLKSNLVLIFINIILQLSYNYIKPNYFHKLAKKFIFLDLS